MYIKSLRVIEVQLPLWLRNNDCESNTWVPPRASGVAGSESESIHVKMCKFTAEINTLSMATQADANNRMLNVAFRQKDIVRIIEAKR